MFQVAASRTTVPDWRLLASTLTFRQSPFIDGAFMESATGGRFKTINPATGEALCDLPVGSRADVNLATDAARAAFDDGRWRDAGPAKRWAALLRLAALVEENGDELALLDSLEMGKAISNACSEIAMGTGLLRYFAETIDKLYGTLSPTDVNVTAFTRPEPRGVVGAIVPWNFPLINAIVKVAPALAVGNSLVLKPSELASLSSLRLAELAMEAGIPAGVFNVVPGLGETVGEAIGSHPDIDFLTFTGSTATGRRLMTLSGQSNGKPLMLELGGKSASIVCEDMADNIEPLARQIVHDAFWNQGQWCAARTRLLVDQRLYDDLTAAIVRVAQGIVPGDPIEPDTKFGTIASQAQFDRISAYLELGRREGAHLLLDGAAGSPCALSMAPTIFTAVKPGMTIAREEIFGPVLCIMRFDDFGEAIRIANDNAYGLGASVWTRDTGRAATASRLLKAGKILIKGHANVKGGSGFALGGEPWGASGFGVERGIEGLRSYCRTKAVEIIP